MHPQSKPIGPRVREAVLQDLGTSMHLCAAIQRRLAAGEVVSRYQLRKLLEAACEPLDQSLVTVEIGLG